MTLFGVVAELRGTPTTRHSRPAFDPDLHALAAPDLTPHLNRRIAAAIIRKLPRFRSWIRSGIATHQRVAPMGAIRVWGLDI